jgi:hypothetical protein
VCVQGELVYHGPPGDVVAVFHQSTINRLSMHENPADFVMDQLKGLKRDEIQELMRNIPDNLGPQVRVVWRLSGNRVRFALGWHFGLAHRASLPPQVPDDQLYNKLPKQVEGAGDPDSDNEDWQMPLLQVRFHPAPFSLARSRVSHVIGRRRFLMSSKFPSIDPNPNPLQEFTHTKDPVKKMTARDKLTNHWRRIKLLMSRQMVMLGRNLEMGLCRFVYVGITSLVFVSAYANIDHKNLRLSQVGERGLGNQRKLIRPLRTYRGDKMSKRLVRGPAEVKRNPLKGRLPIVSLSPLRLDYFSQDAAGCGRSPTARGLCSCTCSPACPSTRAPSSTSSPSVTCGCTR